MRSEMNYPEDFRFKCDLGKFKQCVDITRKMLDGKQISLLFGCFRELCFKIKLSREEYSNIYPELKYNEFRSILKNEVEVIISQNIVEPDLQEPKLKAYLKEELEKEEDIQTILDEKYEKRKYVKDNLMNEEIIPRYRMKEKTLNRKLSGLDYELNRFVFEDESEQLYAAIRFETAKVLSKNGIPGMFMGDTGREETSFVCDKEDLEYIIDVLEKIKERI